MMGRDRCYTVFVLKLGNAFDKVPGKRRKQGVDLGPLSSKTTKLEIRSGQKLVKRIKSPISYKDICIIMHSMENWQIIMYLQACSSLGQDLCVFLVDGGGRALHSHKNTESLSQARPAKETKSPIDTNKHGLVLILCPEWERSINYRILY